MAKIIKQYRYYNDEDSSRNYPTNISYAKLTSGSIFFSDTQVGAITQLGIQALPGTKFYLNNAVDPIIIGSTGIYELDLEGISEITALSFANDSIVAIRNTNSAYLIIDAIYDSENEED